MSTTHLVFLWAELFENEGMEPAFINGFTFRSHLVLMKVSKPYRYQETKKDSNKKGKTTDLRT